MTHTVDGKVHRVTDDDKHFLIDIESKRITHPTETLPVLVQNDHNSERLSFDIPKIIDGHDITTCNLVQVHFINTDKDNVENFNSSIYEVKDLKEAVDDTTKATFTWLIDQAGTHLAGPLTFAIQFACTHTEEGTDNDGNPIVKTVLDYAWNTHPFIGINISDGMNNEEALSDQYYSAVDAWTETIKWYGEEAQKTAVAEIRQKQADAVTAVTNTAAKSKSDAISDIDQHALEVKQNLTEDALDIADVMVQSYTKYYDVEPITDDEGLHYETRYDGELNAITEQYIEESELFGVYTDDGYPVYIHYDQSGAPERAEYFTVVHSVYDLTNTKKIPSLKAVKDIVDKEVIDTYNLVISNMGNVSNHVNDLEDDTTELVSKINKRIDDTETSIETLSKTRAGYIVECEYGKITNGYDNNDETILYKGSGGNGLFAAYVISDKRSCVVECPTDDTLILKFMFVVNVRRSTDTADKYYAAFAQLASFDLGGVDINNLDRFNIRPVSIESVTTTNIDAPNGYVQIGAVVNFMINDTLYTKPVICVGDYVSGSENDGVFMNNVILSNGSKLYIYISSINGDVKVYKYNEAYASTEPNEIIINANGITSITGPTINGLEKTYTIILDDGTTKTFTVEDGKDGKDGKDAIGIDCVDLVEEGDYESTYNIEYGSGSITEFKIPNGNSAGVKTELSGPIIRADNVIPINHKVKTSLRNKNILKHNPANSAEATNNGVTFTRNSDGTITANGTISSITDSANYFVAWAGSLIPVKAGKYFISGCPEGGGPNSYEFVIGWRHLETDQRQLYYEQGAGLAVEWPVDGYIDAICLVRPKDKNGNPVTVSNVVFKPQLELGDTATPYTPYVDLSTVTLTRCGKNLVDMSKIRAINSSTTIESNINTNSITVKAGSMHGITVLDGVRLPKNVKYAFKCDIVGDMSDAEDWGWRVQYTNSPSSLSGFSNSDSLMWLSADYDVFKVSFYVRCGEATTADIIISNIQIEVLDDTQTEATPYEPYTATIHKSTSDGILTTTPRSVSPTMTLLADKPGVIIDTVYNRDVTAIINEVFDNPYTQESDVKEIFHKEFEEATIDAKEEENVVRRTTGGNIALPDQTNCTPADDEYPQPHQAVSREFVESHCQSLISTCHVWGHIDGNTVPVFMACIKPGIHENILFDDVDASGCYINFVVDGSFIVSNTDCSLRDLFLDKQGTTNPFVMAEVKIGYATPVNMEVLNYYLRDYTDYDGQTYATYIFRLIDSESKMYTASVYVDCFREAMDNALDNGDLEYEFWYIA